MRHLAGRKSTAAHGLWALRDAVGSLIAFQVVRHPSVKNTISCRNDIHI